MLTLLAYLIWDSVILTRDAMSSLSSGHFLCASNPSSSLPVTKTKAANVLAAFM